MPAVFAVSCPKLFFDIASNRLFVINIVILLYFDNKNKQQLILCVLEVEAESKTLRHFLNKKLKLPNRLEKCQIN